MVNQVTIDVNGTEIELFENLTITKNLDDLSGSFSFSINAPDDIKNTLVKAGQPCSILVDGERRVSGYIDSLRVSNTVNSHSIIFAGRDKTSDIVDSTLLGIQINAPTTLAKIITSILENLGFNVTSALNPTFANIFSNNISVIDNANPTPFDTGEILKIRNAENAWNAIKRFAQMRQVLVASDANGNIVIDQLGVNNAITVLQNVKTGNVNNNNIKTVEFNLDLTDRFNSYTATSEKEEGLGSAAAAAVPIEKRPDVLLGRDSIGQSGTSTDTEVRSTRQFVSITPVSMTSSECSDRALWEANIRKSNSFVATYKLVGFRQTLSENLALNPLWQPNALVQVNDESSGIFSTMLIRGVEFSQSTSAGSETTLELVDPDAYQLKLSEPDINKSEASKGLLFDDV